MTDLDHVRPEAVPRLQFVHRYTEPLGDRVQIVALGDDIDSGGCIVSTFRMMAGALVGGHRDAADESAGQGGGQHDSRKRMLGLKDLHC